MAAVELIFNGVVIEIEFEVGVDHLEFLLATDHEGRGKLVLGFHLDDGDLDDFEVRR